MRVNYKRQTPPTSLLWSINLIRVHKNSKHQVGENELLSEQLRGGQRKILDHEVEGETTVPNSSKHNTLNIVMAKGTDAKPRESKVGMIEVLTAPPCRTLTLTKDMGRGGRPPLLSAPP